MKLKLFLYAILISASGLSFADDTYGDGIDKSIIRFVSTTPTSKVDFVTTAGNIAFDRLTIYHDGPVSETAQIITLENNNIQVTNCKIKSNDSVSVDTQHQPTVSSSEIRNIEQQTRDLNGSYYHQHDNGEFYYAACCC